MKRIVTERELETNAQNGVFRVTKDMILTPFARDFAVERGIELQYGSESQDSAVTSVDDDALTAAILEIVEAELGDMSSVLESAAQENSAPAYVPADGQDSITQAVTAVLSEKHRTDEQSSQAVITVAGENHSGIVAQVSQVIGDMGANIIDVSQTVVGNYFTMILVVDIGELERSGTGFSAFRESVQTAAKRAGVAANVMHENILKTMHRVV